MSALGQKRTWRQVRTMSALPPKADIRCRFFDVRFVPEADIATSFEQCVGALQKLFWNCKAYDLRSLKIDGQFELRGLLNR